LYKSKKIFNTMAEMYADIEVKTKLGEKEKQIEELRWKYYFEESDEIVMPKFNFNIESNYPTMENNQLTSEDKKFRIERIWQRTAFILDENGAEIESEAEVELVVEELEEEYEKPKPKIMRFDKPFLLVLKRKDSNNPYFGLWTTNTELMIKE